jgi:hypothetical protein
MWKAYYRRQPLRLFALLVEAEHEQARVSWLRALVAAVWLTKGAVGFARSTGDYDRFLPDIERGYGWLRLPPSVDVAAVARRELRWWVVRREIGPAAGEAAGEAIAKLYAALYDLPEAAVQEAGRLRGLAAEVRDRGATADPDGPRGPGRAYWPEVARLLKASYRSLRVALDAALPPGDGPAAVAEVTQAGSGGAANAYHFITVWHVSGTPAEINEILGDAEGLARWWPSVYLRVAVLESGDEQGVGRIVDLWTKGWLPYTLRWRFRVTESDPPHGFALEASGDFVGRGIWRLAPEASDAGEGPRTSVEYDWRIVAEKGLLKHLSFLFKPLFAANHRWAMGRGEESLRLELARRHAAGDPALRAAIPAAPGPTFAQRAGRARRAGPA